MIRIAFLGDIFGATGRRVIEQQLPVLRELHEPDVVIANAENMSRGLGLTPDLYKRMRTAGIDAITLGDHVFRDSRIVSVLNDPDAPILRPANLPAAAAGRDHIMLPPAGRRTRPLLIGTVLGRVFFPTPVDSPFDAADRLLELASNRNAIAFIEVHMEATSEKSAMAHHLDGRAAAVIGTHTHVQTSDARILPGGTAFMTDAGMCGPHDSCIGRDKDAVVKHMTTGMYVPFDIATSGPELNGVVITVDEETGRATEITAVRQPADESAPPFDRVLQ